MYPSSTLLLTQEIIKASNMEIIRSRRADCPRFAFGKPTVVRANVFTKQSELTPESRTSQRLSGLSRWKVVDVCREPCPAVAREGDYRIQRPDERGFLTFAACCHLVVLDCLADLAVDSSSGPFG